LFGTLEGPPCLDWLGTLIMPRPTGPAPNIKEGGYSPPKGRGARGGALSHGGARPFGGGSILPGGRRGPPGREARGRPGGGRAYLRHWGTGGGRQVGIAVPVHGWLRIDGVGGGGGGTADQAGKEGLHRASLS